MLLSDLLEVVRSKNSGPYELTFDLIFRRAEDYERLKRNGCISAATVMRLYHLREEDILGIHYFDAAQAVKVTVKRPRAAGDPGETDVYGAQQHAPWLSLEVPG